MSSGRETGRTDGPSRPNPPATLPKESPSVSAPTLTLTPSNRPSEEWARREKALEEARQREAQQRAEGARRNEENRARADEFRQREVEARERAREELARRRARCAQTKDSRDCASRGAQL